MLGDMLQFTVTVRNDATLTTAVDAVVTDAVPAGLQVIPGTLSTGAPSLWHSIRFVTCNTWLHHDNMHRRVSGAPGYSLLLACHGSRHLLHQSPFTCLLPAGGVGKPGGLPRCSLLSLKSLLHCLVVSVYSMVHTASSMVCI